MIKKVLSLAAVIALNSGIASADNVVMANDGLGDFLIAPVYVAKNNICSDVTVMNTNETNSILAKVTFREEISSQEVDFPIFLSPGDVWDGRVCGTVNGVVLTSNDDSNHPLVREMLKRGKNLTLQSKAAGHNNIDFSKGYVEVYPIAEFNEMSKKKVNKNVLVKRWDALIKGDTSNPKLNKRGVDGYSLTGTLSFVTKGTNFETSTMNMLAFKGTDDKQVTGAAIAYSNDTSPDLLLGTQKKNEILKLLQKQTLSFKYNNSGKNQFITLTFPFGYTDDQVRTYEVTVRDMSEDKSIKEKKVVIFSPIQQEKKVVNSVENEVATISVSDIIAHTSNPDMFKKGMIQIKDITNASDVQLGNNARASVIGVKLTYGTTIVKNPNGKNLELDDISSANYVPSK